MIKNVHYGGLKREEINICVEMRVMGAAWLIISWGKIYQISRNCFVVSLTGQQFLSFP